MEIDAVLDDLKYPDDKSKLVPLQKGYIGMLKTFKQFVAKQYNDNVTIDDAYWLTVTRKDFNAFRVSMANSTTPIVPNTVLPSVPTPCPPPVIDPVHEF